MGQVTTLKTDGAAPTTPSTFPEALVKLQGAIKTAAKDATNPAFKSKYADLGAVWEAVKPALQANGFALIQSPNFGDGEMWLETILLHVSGERLTGRYPLRPMKQDPQGYGSALTYARRYSISAMLGVVADEDDDGNAASAKPAPKQVPAQAPVMDADIEEGVRNWTALRRTEIDEAVRLPDLYQWQDVHESALARLKSKHPSAYNGLMQYFSAKFEILSKKEA